MKLFPSLTAMALGICLISGCSQSADTDVAGEGGTAATEATKFITIGTGEAG